MFESKLTTFVTSLPPSKLAELDRALAVALDLPVPARRGNGGSSRRA